jgi:hypothetical protein
MNKILDVVEDIKNKLTDNEYKTIMDSLMEVHKIENKNINVKGFVFKCFTLMNWLDSKLIFQLDTDTHKQIKKTKLEEYIIKRLYDNRYYENIDFVRKVLELYLFQIPKKQTSKLYYYHVDFKYGEEEEGY